MFVHSIIFNYTLVSSSGKVFIVDIEIASSGTSSGRIYLAMLSFLNSKQHKTVKNVNKIKLPKTTPIIRGVLSPEGVGIIVAFFQERVVDDCV